MKCPNCGHYMFKGFGNMVYCKNDECGYEYCDYEEEFED